MVAFHDGDATGTPGTSQIEVVGTLATDVTFANVLLWSQDQLKPVKHMGIVSLT